MEQTNKEKKKLLHGINMHLCDFFWIMFSQKTNYNNLCKNYCWNGKRNPCSLNNCSVSKKKKRLCNKSSVIIILI